MPLCEGIQYNALLTDHPRRLRRRNDDLTPARTCWQPI